MKLHNRFYLYCTILGSSLSLVSCTLMDEFDKISSIESIEATGSFNANVLNETWMLKDLLPTQELSLVEGEDGNYSFVYQNKSNYNIKPVTIPSMDLAPIAIPLSPLNESSDYTNTQPGQFYAAAPRVLNFEIPKPEMEGTTFSDDYKLTAVKLKDGATMTLNLEIDSNSDTQMVITIPSMTKDGVPYSKTFNPIYGSANTQLLMNDLGGYILKPEGGISAIIQPKIRRISSRIEGEIKTSLSMNIANNQEYIEGFFGEMNLPVETIEFPFTMSEDFKGDNESHMTLKELTLTLKMNTTGVDVPFDLDLSQGNLCYYKGNSTPKAIEFIPVANTATPGTFTYKIKNINVLNIEKLVLNPIITLNKGLTSGENKITDAAAIEYDIDANLPLDIDAGNVSFEQEGDNAFYEDETEVNESDFEFVAGKIILKGTVESELPMGTLLQVYYKENSEDDTYKQQLLDMPLAVAANEKSEFLISITKEKLDELKKYKYQVMKITLNGEGAITGNQKINVKLGLAAKGSVKYNLTN